ncbi:universal stress protein [Alicyclobacillus macrosporangiidus]|jgi:nucleotide-binding universal stress UspA family protein|uniref:Nucleotide-binding universal stress protein, UspA family n=1 Tax=Alicyclobacillus macrosporangiidus TaxID=392015 RepID=A0A1I7F651_9BACL|nr:universal stress protein [Alicyclobacillus macrosporangiidus]SFU31683.1 Nucleotide-binding universal stress protein, UspA family [Alicyclobacillus macrosporangiidus]
MKKIVLATDGSPSAHKAADMVNHLCSAWPDTEVVAVYVSPELPYPYAMSLEDYRREENLYALDVRQDLMQHLTPAVRPSVTFRHMFGDPCRCICEVAEEETADVVVMGSNGKGVLDRLLMGSVSRGVVDRSKVPVLVVRAS